MSGADHAGRAQQLKMFMTPREITEGYGPHDADRFITATHQPDGIGQLGERRSIHPLMMAARPEEFGLIQPYTNPDFEGRKEADAYIERWHQSKAKFDRGEGNDPDSGDMYYEAGDFTPGTREHNEWQGYTNPDFTDRENYLDQWMGMSGIEGLKEDMTEVGFTGDVDSYLDWQEAENYEYQKSQKKFNLKSTHDPSTWFERDQQYWKRTLEKAKEPTEELHNAARAEGAPETMSLMPEGLGAFARVEGMGVEKPIVLGLDPEVNVTGSLKRPIWEGEHDLISAYKQKPDVLIPVEHTSRTGSYGSYADAFYPHAERQEGWEPIIELEKDEIAANADVDRAVREAHLALQSDEGEKAFWDVQPPKNLPGQRSLFD